MQVRSFVEAFVWHRDLDGELDGEPPSLMRDLSYPGGDKVFLTDPILKHIKGTAVFGMTVTYTSPSEVFWKDIDDKGIQYSY